MILKVDILDLRRMLREKADEVSGVKSIADELYRILCDIEEDNRFTEIIRCKDCKYGHYENSGFYSCEQGFGLVQDGDWFCTDGKMW